MRILPVFAALFLAVGYMPHAGYAAAGGNGNGGGDHGAAGGDHGNSGNAAGGGASANASGHDNSGHGQAANGAVAAGAGALNAAHASPTALAHAAPGSTVGKIASYDHAMLAALAIPDVTPAQTAARNAAIAAARTQLANSTNKSLTPAVVSHVDKLLGLPAVDPTLGVQSGT